MENLNHLLVVFTAYVIAAGSPGPSTLRIMGVAMNQGRRAGLALVAGVISGSPFWGLSAATGISALLARYAEALIVLKISGRIYLLYLAFRAARSALTSDPAISSGSPRDDYSPNVCYALSPRIDHASRKPEGGAGLDRPRHLGPRSGGVVA